MNVATAAFLATLLLFGPGLCAIYVYQHTRRLPFPDFRRIHIALLAFIMTVGFNVALFAFVRPGAPGPLLPTGILESLAGLVGLPPVAQGEAPAVELRSWSEAMPSLVAYAAVAFLVPTAVGSLAGFMRYLFTPPSLEELTFIRSRSVFTVVDVLVSGGTLYRGIFHSYAEVEEGMGETLNLAICSKWQAPASPQHSDREPRAIKASVTRPDLLELLFLERRRQRGNAELAEEEIRKIDSPEVLQRYLDDRLSAPPQMSFFPAHVVNVNSLLFVADRG